VRFPGLHVSQFAAQVAIDTGIPDFRNPPPEATEEQKIDAATAAQRMANIGALGGGSGIKVVTSHSTANYPMVAADCDQRRPPARDVRRARCESAPARCVPGGVDLGQHVVGGTDRILTSPLAGTTFGLVDGMNPINLAPVGGAQFFVDEDLTGMDAFAIYWQFDDTPGPGTLLALRNTARPVSDARRDACRAREPTAGALSADLAIFADLGQDETNF